MNSIARSRAAKIAADFFPEQAGMNTRHAGTATKPTPHGTQGRSGKFQKDVSIAGPDSEKCEW